MRTGNTSILVSILALIVGVAWANGCREPINRKPIPTVVNPGERLGLRLNVRAADNHVSPEDPGKVEISLVNKTRDPVWIDRRLVLGYHINLYVIGNDGRPAKLIYPAVTLVLPHKDDFVRLQPGKSIARLLEVTADMLPKSVRQSGYWTFVVKVTIFDTGYQFGIRGWKGSLKSYVKLKVAHSRGKQTRAK